MAGTLFMSVYCDNDYASGYPESLVIEITDDFKARIKELSAAVKDLGVHCIREFNYEGSWLISDMDELRAKLAEGRREEILCTANENIRAVDVPIISVFQHSFRFTAASKALDCVHEIFSCRVNISELDCEGDHFIE